MKPERQFTLQEWDIYLKALQEDRDKDGETLERAVRQTIEDLRLKGLPDSVIEQELHRIFS